MPVTSVQRGIQEFRPEPTSISRSFQNISPATDPGFKSLLDQILGGIPKPEAAPEIQGPEQFLSQLAPLLQIILEPLMARLQKGEASARAGVTDAFRAAGGGKGPSRSTAFGQSTAQLEGELQGRRGDLLSSVTAQTLSPLLQSLLGEQAQRQSSFFKEQELKQAPTNMLTRILQLVAPQLVQSGQTTSGGSQFLETSRSTNAPGGGGGVSSGGSRGLEFSAESQRVRDANKIGFERGQTSPGGTSPSTTIAPAPAPGRTLEEIVADAIALDPSGGGGGGGIQFDPATGGFVSTSGAGDFGVGSQGGIADFNQSDPFGIF